MTLRMKSAAKLLAEEEAKRVIDEAQALAEARSAAKDKARKDDEAWFDAAKESARAKAMAIAAEEARIAAAGRDEWYFIRDHERIGPVELAELRRQVADTSVEPPVRLVWTE